MSDRIKTSKKQQLVLDFVRRYVLENGYGPSRPEIAEALGVKHVTTVGFHLQALEKKGWIELRHDTPRAIRVIQSDRIPVLEVTSPIPVDEPLLAPHRIVEYMPELLKHCLAPTAQFCLRLGENGMKGPGFGKGDLVAIRTTGAPKMGQSVVVRVDGEVLCRVLRRKDERFVELVTLGPDGKPEGSSLVSLAEHEFRFEGVVVRAFADIDFADYDYLEEPPPE